MQFGGSQVLCDTRKTTQMDERTGTLELAQTAPLGSLVFDPSAHYA